MTNKNLEQKIVPKIVAPILRNLAVAQMAANLEIIPNEYLVQGYINYLKQNKENISREELNKAVGFLIYSEIYKKLK